MLDVAASGGSPLRLYGLTGYAGRLNDVVYYQPLDSTYSENQNLVIFFGGDVQVPGPLHSFKSNGNITLGTILIYDNRISLFPHMQDFTANMESSEENKNYCKWSLENTAFILHSSYPDSHVMVVRPSRIEFKTFSCFDNFVPSNGSGGAPEHTPTHGALQHLERLIQTLMQRIHNEEVGLETRVDSQQQQQDENETIQNRERTQDWPDLNKAELKIIGFSKGCVVLNQLLYEFHYLKTLTPDDDTMMKLVSRIRDMYWLDGGHSGGKNTWITSRSLLETLSRLDIRVNVHVTPYQIQDDRRPWIRKEEHVFTETLKRLGVQINRQLHFETKPPNIFTHFQVLNAVFEPCDNF